jgi:MoaA/NifB/PqqE/SkfB family radical SAM enzyme
MQKVNKNTGGVILSPSCHLFCRFCNGRSKKSEFEIREQGIKIYKNLVDFKNQGIKKIEISGCDPIEYKNIAELIAYIKKEGFECVRLSTHGTELAKSSLRKKLALSGLDDIRIPIYGSTAKIHDSVTRTPGSFKETVEGIKKIKELNPKIHIQISCLMVKQNKNDLLNIVKFTKNELKIEDLYFSIPCIAKELIPFYIPFKNLKLWLKKFYKAALEINQNTRFLEIPFCLFGEFNPKNINNTSVPPNLGRYNQPPKIFETSIPNMPSYRLKRKLKICAKCKANKYCSGFFVNDLNKFGITGIKPLK